jgi:flagellar assembly protein FliH
VKASDVKGQVTVWQPPGPGNAATGLCPELEIVKPSRIVRAAATRLAAQPFEVAVLEPPNFPLPHAEAMALEQATETRRQETACQDEVDAAWEDRLEEATAQAHNQGYAQAQADLQDEINAQKAMLATDVAHLKDCWDDFVSRCETLLAQIAFEVAEALLDAPLPESVKEATATSLAGAIEQLAGEAPLAVTLHPVDYLRLQETGVVERLEAVFQDLRWHADPDLAQGDWVVLSPTAAIRRFKQELLQDLLHRLGLPSQAS